MAAAEAGQVRGGGGGGGSLGGGGSGEDNNATQIWPDITMVRRRISRY